MLLSTHRDTNRMLLNRHTHQWQESSHLSQIMSSRKWKRWGGGKVINSLNLENKLGMLFLVVTFHWYLFILFLFSLTLICSLTLSFSLSLYRYTHTHIYRYSLSVYIRAYIFSSITCILTYTCIIQIYNIYTCIK